MTSILPETMTAIVIEAPGGPEVLKPATLPVPSPGACEILIRVAAAGVNRPDVLQRRGMYNPPPGASPLPGLEVAGTVAAIGPDVEGWSVGDPACALVAGGGYAEYCVAPAPQCLPIPKGLSPAEAAGLPETLFTVWTNVVERGRLQPGERFLVHGGSSGIGTTAIQLAKARGATVFATAGSAEKCRACLDLGADVAIDYREQDFAAVIREKTGGRGVDVILDMVGGDYVARNIDALAVDGRQVSIAFLKGAKVEVDLQKVMAKRLTLTGSTLRPRSVAEKGAIAAALEAEVWPLIEAGRIKPVIHASFPLARAAEAHALMESSAHVGKIILLA
ncbi:NAD(P)H-quinone oxidoreductase [Inquilinus sp. Marseille-Q2685]|uniref:NAD(P)H-quinone oxidoreductase n=1 Tax=Inquilinus sp. Marseille-Q2685 TaxID=2866581 RepID=UPI001CE3F758|nr:NAD(P)H-quinone oxidoreductase [Inquilinus sp. Marseille-Q2685]